MAHTCCMLDKQGYMHVRACTCPHACVPTYMHTQTNKKYLLLLHGNNDLRTHPITSWQQWFTNASHWYVIHTLPVLFGLKPQGFSNPEVEQPLFSHAQSTVLFFCNSKLPCIIKNMIMHIMSLDLDLDLCLCSKWWLCENRSSQSSDLPYSRNA
jgi:hypothetical protein